MRRDHYSLFSPFAIGPLKLSNRLVRSATWDPSILKKRAMTDGVLELYTGVAKGGPGLIITGDFSVLPDRFFDQPARHITYQDVRIDGYARLAEVVHRAAPGCRIIAQVSAEYPGVGPSDVPSPFSTDGTRPLSTPEVRQIAECFAVAIAGLREDGFDGVQLHAAHGGMLSRFLSTYSNRRDDEYGGTTANRVRIIREIVSAARDRVGDWPILIKMNSTDYLDGGIDAASLRAVATEVKLAGVDAIEFSGGIWDCLARPEAELGFRPVPAPKSHTNIARPDSQSYFLPLVERLNLGIPRILVGGNRNVERLEHIVREGKAELISLCRPLICEPDLPRRWLEGRGSSDADCVSCNSCLYEMYTSLDKGQPVVASCVFKRDRGKVREAQRWLRSWVERNQVGRQDQSPAVDQVTPAGPSATAPCPPTAEAARPPPAVMTE